MGALAFVEVLDRRGLVQTRVGLQDLPATIGRGYTNDVILDDPYVSPQHAGLVRTPDGVLVLEDLDSLNGIHLEGGQRVTRVPIVPGTVVRLGHTRIRFATPDQEVPPTLSARRASRLERLPRSRWYAGVATAAAVLVFAFGGWASSYEEHVAVELVGGALGMLLLLAIWAGIWSLFARVALHRFHFLAHLAVVSTIVVLFSVSSQLQEYLFFLAPTEFIALPLGVIMLCLAALLVYGHLLFVSTLSRRARIAWSLGVPAVLLVLAGLVQLAEQEDFDVFTEDPGTLKPLTRSLIPARSAEDYFARLGDLKVEVDELAIDVK